MAPKRKMTPKASSDVDKKKRKMLTLKEKVKILDMIKQGHTYASVARSYGLNESTVRYMYLLIAFVMFSEK